MNSYYFIYDVFASLNTITLVLYSFLAVYYFNKKLLWEYKIIAIYLLFSCFFDLTTFLIMKYVDKTVIHDTFFLSVLYRCGELILISYFIYQNVLKYKIVWFFVSIGIIGFIYELFTYKSNNVLNYVSYAQIYAGILLCILCISGLLSQLQSEKRIHITHQLILFIFLSYLAVYLVYTVVQNFILNQSFSNRSFVLFYSSYALLHVVYYFALAYVIRKNVIIQNIKIKKLNNFY